MSPTRAVAHLFREPVQQVPIERLAGQLGVDALGVGGRELVIALAGAGGVFRPAGHGADVSFSPRIPATISPMQTSRAGAADSENSTMPRMAVPTAPMPVQMA
jgi:hypothetical protein